ncbi:response regulator [Chitinophaga sp. NPDC101104]|uniref:response regulator n=1 Tax=Chitinophaga sp. NPDC101104 TaxID=3390561 RepID=UPI003CFC8D2C
MKKTILVVDDSVHIRMLLEAMLQHKYKVYTAEDGLSALMWLAAGNTPDIIITDIQMPRLDGWELISNLNSNLLFNDIPVMVLTGISLHDVNFVHPNVVHVINKPFDPRDLIEKIGFQLNRELPMAANG